MGKCLAIVVSFVLFTFRFVSATIEANEMISKDVPQAQNSENIQENSLRRVLGSLPGRRLGKLGKNHNREDIESLRQVLQSDIEWQPFAPPTVVEPNCYVEVQVTQRMPGRCTKLGGRIPACQAQDLVTIDYSSCE